MNEIPKFGEHFKLNEIMSDPIGNVVQKMCVKMQKDNEEIVINEILKEAKEMGITDLIVLDKKKIMAALKKQIPKTLRVDDDSLYCCRNCDETFFLHNLFHEKNRYCGKCGQKLKWE